MNNILTIDVEDWFHLLEISSAISLKDWSKLESRVVKNTLLILDLLRPYNTKATFFVLGWVAQYFPDLIREIDKQGHEIGTHGYSHELIYNLTPKKFYEDVSISLDYISRIINKPILGYRAPGFSLTSNTIWALDILLKLGLTYDASIFPLKRNHGGLPGFTDEGGWIKTPQDKHILEIPVTPTDLLGKQVYLLGGGYFRLAPYKLIESGIKQLNSQNKPALVYLHPREFDPNHPRLKMNKFRSFTSYVNLEQTQIKFEKMLQNFRFNTIESIWNLSSIYQPLSYQMKAV